MDLEQLNDQCFYFPGRVNIGYIRQGREGMIIDTGIDDSAMKKALRRLKELDLPVTYLFITHAHADHYGGAAYLQKQMDITTIAPYLEEAILRNPVLEPIYLFGGNDPLPELRNKFLEGKPVVIDHIIREGTHTYGELAFTAHLLPGHSYYQLGIEYQDILFAGDGYFGEEQLHLHKIPYVTDAKAAMESLKKITQLHCRGAVPGHGKYEEEYKKTVEANLKYHQSLLDWMESKIGSSGISHEDLVAEMCREYKVKTNQLSQWLLYRTAVTSYITALLHGGKITHRIEEGKWMLYPD